MQMSMMFLSCPNIPAVGIHVFRLPGCRDGAQWVGEALPPHPLPCAIVRLDHGSKGARRSPIIQFDHHPRASAGLMLIAMTIAVERALFRRTPLD